MYVTLNNNIKKIQGKIWSELFSPSKKIDEAKKKFKGRKLNI